MTAHEAPPQPFRVEDRVRRITAAHVAPGTINRGVVARIWFGDSAGYQPPSYYAAEWWAAMRIDGQEARFPANWFELDDPIALLGGIR